MQTPYKLPMRTPILLYHAVTKGVPKASTYGEGSLSVEQFVRQMEYLHGNGYRSLSLLDWILTSENRHRHMTKEFVLTFDDGYLDFFTQVFPILRRYGFTATVFLVTEQVGGYSNWEGSAGMPLLGWEHARIMQTEGITFESHTCTHPRLPRLRPDEAWRELVVSKKHLEKNLKRETRFLSYPFCHSNAQIQEMAEKAGYLAALAGPRGNSRRFNLLRREIHSVDTLLTFRLKLNKFHRFPDMVGNRISFGRKWLRIS